MGGTIQWQIFSETHGSTETDMSTKTRSAVEDHAQKMMEDSVGLWQKSSDSELSSHLPQQDLPERLLWKKTGTGFINLYFSIF